MAKIALIYLPPSKLYAAKGASFIHQANSKATVVKLTTDPEKRRSQVAILKLAMESCGAPKKAVPVIGFTRTGPKAVTVNPHLGVGPLVAGHWLHSPAMLRAHLAFIDGTAHPINRNDIAHFMWFVRTKDAKIDWHWPGLTLNGSTPKPVVASDLTPVFAGAKIVMYGETRIW